MESLVTTNQPKKVVAESLPLSTLTNNDLQELVIQQNLILLKKYKSMIAKLLKDLFSIKNLLKISPNNDEIIELIKQKSFKEQEVKYLINQIQEINNSREYENSKVIDESRRQKTRKLILQKLYSQKNKIYKLHKRYIQKPENNLSMV